MNYHEGLYYIWSLLKNHISEEIAHSHCTVIKRYPDGITLSIKYPGQKPHLSIYDFCVYWNNNKISHSEVMKALHKLTTVENYPYVKQYIDRVATYGNLIDSDTKTHFDDNQNLILERLADTMFFIGLQEDINYAARKKQGRILCFSRYLEAIFCATHKAYHLTDAIDRANNFFRSPPLLWEEADQEHLYDIVINIQNQQYVTDLLGPFQSRGSIAGRKKG